MSIRRWLRRWFGEPCREREAYDAGRLAGYEEGLHFIRHTPHARDTGSGDRDARVDALVERR